MLGMKRMVRLEDALDGVITRGEEVDWLLSYYAHRKFDSDTISVFLRRARLLEEELLDGEANSIMHCQRGESS